MTIDSTIRTARRVENGALHEPLSGALLSSGMNATLDASR